MRKKCYDRVGETIAVFEDKTLIKLKGKTDGGMFLCLPLQMHLNGLMKI